MFARNSFWNQRLPGSVPIDANSAAIVANLVKQVEEFSAGLAFNDFSVPIFRAGPHTPTQKVTVDHENQTGQIAEDLKVMFAEVPIPPTFRPVGPWPSGDHHAVIYRENEDGTIDLWEGWHWANFAVDGANTVTGVSSAVLEAPGWHVVMGAAVKDVATNPGYFTGFPGVTGPEAYGARASGLLLPGGAITADEAQRGYCGHAIALSTKKADAYHTPRWPAQRCDGESSNAMNPCEGMCFTLPRNYDVSGITDPFARLIAREIRDFGGYVCDGTSNGLNIKLVCEATIPGAQGYSFDRWKGPHNEFGEAHGAILNGNASVAGKIPVADFVVVDASYRPSTLAPGVML